VPPANRHTPVLRVLGFVVAAALGILGVWLIVTGNSSKNVRIGAIAAFWGLLIGTYAVFGSRLPSRPADPAPQPVAPQPPPPQSRELDLRQISEIERSALAAARREFAQELQLMLRRETQAGFAQEVAGLRAEVTALRNELVEKVGGQLRLERIETTRLIGSDLEALQSELRKLRERNHELDIARRAQLPVAIPIAPLAAQQHDIHDIHDAEIVSDGVQVTVPVGPHLVEPPQRAPEPVQRAPEPVQRAPEPRPAPFAPRPSVPSPGVGPTHSATPTVRPPAPPAPPPPAVRSTLPPSRPHPRRPSR